MTQVGKEEKWLVALGRLLRLNDGQLGSLRRLVLLGLVGLLVLLAADVLGLFAGRQPDSHLPAVTVGAKAGPPANAAGAAESSELPSLARHLAGDLERQLSQVDGVGKVSVWVYLESGPQQSVAENRNTTSRKVTERDPSGLVRETAEATEQAQPVLARTDDRPIVLHTAAPKVAGVLIVAEGARYAMVRQRLLEAVERALGIGAHRIEILPSQGG